MSILFRCAQCNVDQAIATSAVEVYTTLTGAPLVHCVCPDCGEGTLVRVSARMASEVDYWQANDRIQRARERAYARGGGIHPSQMVEAYADVVEGCERLLREVAE